MHTPRRHTIPQTIASVQKFLLFSFFFFSNPLEEMNLEVK